MAAINNARGRDRGCSGFAGLPTTWLVTLRVKIASGGRPETSTNLVFYTPHLNIEDIRPHLLHRGVWLIGFVFATMIVCDLQGVLDAEGKYPVFRLIDPAINTVNRRKYKFGKTDCTQMQWCLQRSRTPPLIIIQLKRSK